MKKFLIFSLVLLTLPTVSFAREYDNYADCTQDNGTKFCDGYFAGKTKTSDATKSKDVAPEAVKTENAAATETTTQTTKTETETNKSDNYVFVGGNLGFAAVSYKEESASDYMPSAFLKLGLEFGFKFDVADDYGLGLTGVMDFLAPSEMNPSYVHAMGADSITVGFDMYGFYLDNYLKTGENETLVFGIGGADIYETVTAEIGGKTYSDETDESSGAFMIKMGMIYSLSEMTDFTIMGKFGFPDDKLGLSMITMLDLGLRLKF